MKTLWVVGKRNQSVNNDWELQGIFDTEEKAIKVCKGKYNYFIGPVCLNMPIDDSKLPWPGAYYPQEIEDYRYFNGQL